MIKTTLYIGLFMLTFSVAVGQSDSHKWKYSLTEVIITPYFWLPWINSTLSIDRILLDAQSDVDVSPVELYVNVVYKTEDGKIARTSTFYNEGDAMRQLGYYITPPLIDIE